MSIRFPDFNSGKTSTVSVRGPFTGLVRAASRSTATFLLVQVGDTIMDDNRVHTILSRANGGPSGNDGWLSINNTCTNLQFVQKHGGTTLFDLNCAVSPGKTYLVAMLSDPAYTHLVVAETAVSGTYVRNTVASGTLYSTGLSGSFWDAFMGGNHASNFSWYGAIEDFNFFLGAFPESAAGIPDETVIRDLATGIRDFPSLVGGSPGLGLANVGSSVPASHVVRFPMKHEGDLVASVGTNTIVPTNLDRASGAALYTSGPLRPGPIVPAFTRDCISQVVFATPGDTATAFADVKVVGGVYSGLTTIDRMQVRLETETGVVIQDWMSLTTSAPVAGVGTWSASAGFSNVPMTAAYLQQHFRALDSSNAVLAESYGYGLCGAGFHFNTTGQSQLMYMFATGAGLALTSGLRGNIHWHTDTALPAVRRMLSATTPINKSVRRGVRQLMIEIDARFPGVPIQVDTIGQSGTPITDHYGAGPYAGRAGLMAASLGIVQPYFMVYVGHSASGGGSYQTHLGDLVAHIDADLGPAIMNLHVPVPRYMNSGTDEASGNASLVSATRRGARGYCLANPDQNIWCGSWSTIECEIEPSASSDPHPKDTNAGQGRTGGMIAWAGMSTARAVEDVVLGISAVRAVGSDAEIHFGAINPANFF